MGRLMRETFNNFYRKTALVGGLFLGILALAGWTLGTQENLKAEHDLASWRLLDQRSFALQIMQESQRKALSAHSVSAARASWDFRVTDRKTENTIIKRLTDDAKEIRLAALQDFVIRGLKSPAAVPALSSLAKEFPYLSARAIYQIGPLAKDAVPAMAAALAETPITIDEKNSSALSLNARPGKGFEPQGLERLATIVAALGSLGKAAHQAAPALVRVRSEMLSNVRDTMISPSQLRAALDTVQWALVQVTGS